MLLKKEVKKLYRDSFGKGDLRIFYSHGRLEIIGNHTDHQGGVCIVAGVDLGITAAVRPNTDGAIRVVSEGFAPFMFHVDELALKKGERGTTIAVFKGILATLKKKGYNIGGFTAALKSDVPVGSGLSSSAALESLVCHIENAIYNKGKIDKFECAKIAQIAENEYFGKPCGLLDQIGCEYGGLKYLDFHDGVKIEKLKFNLNLKIYIVNAGSSHAELASAYATIPNDMFAVATDILGVERLSDSTAEEYAKKIGTPCSSVSERAKLRAQHYFDEIKRVENARKAIENGDPDSFLQAVRLSQNSSHCMLANTFIPGIYDHSPQNVVDVASLYIGHGACRIMGGGFGGSVICFVFPSEEKVFVDGMKKAFGEASVIPVSILAGGPREVAD